MFVSLSCICEISSVITRLCPIMSDIQSYKDQLYYTHFLQTCSIPPYYPDILSVEYIYWWCKALMVWINTDDKGSYRYRWLSLGSLTLSYAALMCSRCWCDYNLVTLCNISLLSYVMLLWPCNHKSMFQSHVGFLARTVTFTLFPSEQ